MSAIRENSLSMRRVLQYSSTVACGYIPMGIAFGILFTTQTGYSKYYAILMSVFTLAGAAQFLSVTLLVNQVSFFNVFLIILLVNARHFFYGLYTFDLYRKHCVIKRLYLLFALTDETFSIISTLPKTLQRDKNTALYISVLNHMWWVLGSAIGAILGSSMQLDIPGIGFVLTALFVVLLIEMLYQQRRALPVVCACIAAAASLVLFRGQHFLVTSLAIGALLFFAGVVYARYIRS